MKRLLTVGALTLATSPLFAGTAYTDITDAAQTAFETVAAIVVTIMIFYVGVRQVRKGLGGGR